MPPQQSVSKGGWEDFLSNANQGAICWSNYAIMADDLGQSPKLVVCPADERQAAAEFHQQLRKHARLLLYRCERKRPISPINPGGDRNLGPGTKPDPDYGYSPKSGKGNDVAIPISGPVSWSLKMHSAGNTAGAGNILLGDGSAQQVSSASFNQNWLRNAAPTTNWPAGHIPATPSIRLVFP